MFNDSTSHMKLYDVAFTSYHAQDGQALLAMSAAAGASELPLTLPLAI